MELTAGANPAIIFRCDIPLLSPHILNIILYYIILYQLLYTYFERTISLISVTPCHSRRFPHTMLKYITLFKNILYLMNVVYIRFICLLIKLHVPTFRSSSLLVIKPRGIANLKTAICLLVYVVQLSTTDSSIHVLSSLPYTVLVLSAL